MTRPVYMTSDGLGVHSVTQILGATRSSDGLIDWAVRLARRGDDHEAVRDRAARVGTLTHELIAAHLIDRGPVFTEEATDDEIRDAEAAFARWQAMASARRIEPVLIEQPLVSEQQQYGGTPDLLAVVDGVRTVIDFKSGRYPGGKGLLQLGAYAHLLAENGYGPVERGMIACIGHRDTGLYSFGSSVLHDAWVAFLVLMHAVDVWHEADDTAEAMRRPTNDWLD